MIHKKQKQKTALFLVQVIVIIINTLLFAAIWYGYYKSRMWGNTFYGKGDALVVALYFIIYTIMAQLYKGLAFRTHLFPVCIYSYKQLHYIHSNNVAYKTRGKYIAVIIRNGNKLCVKYNMVNCCK